ncbi:hypothetical protein HN51_058609 [Arachis hypogaea]
MEHDIDKNWLVIASHLLAALFITLPLQATLLLLIAIFCNLVPPSLHFCNYILALTVENFLKCRLQTLVFKSGIAKSIHHAKVLIRQHHIRSSFLLFSFF